jgi:Ni,Fe-hydrogenase III small subunit/NAD-dependent dihydropyrimidine dehydrogenase PreA subunit
MFLNDLKIVKHQGKQFIKDLTLASLPETFRGVPIISKETVNHKELIEFCPTAAISGNEDKVRIDLGKCVFCGDCQKQFPNKIRFTNNYRMATNVRDNLIVGHGGSHEIIIEAGFIRNEIRSIFNRSLKLRQVSAGGDNSNELELGACGNVNFDMGRYGIEFTASPRHADGIVLTGPITENMADALKLAYEAVPDPKLFILAGTDAISGGIFAESKALNRNFLKQVHVDLYVPGNPIHPLTFINGILELTRKKFRRRV